MKLPPPETRDFVGRAVMTLYFTVCATLKAATVVMALRDPEWTGVRIVDVMANIAALGFLLLIVATTMGRLPPVKTAQGIEPRISALIGCFATATLIAVPSMEMFPKIQVVADLVTMFGFVLCIWCLWSLGRSFSITAQARRLVTAGPYQIVRHPLYACEAVVLLGIVLRNPTWATFTIGTIVLAFQYRRMINEEKVLKMAFPEYSDYRQTTPMLIPFLNRPANNVECDDIDTGTRNHLAIIILVIAFFALTDFVWLPFSTVEFSPMNWFDVGRVAVGLIASGAVAKFVLKRLGSDASAMASVIRHLSKSLLMLMPAAAAFIPLTIATSVFMYLASATARPLMDGQLASLDTRLGFDWLGFLAASNHSAVWSSALYYAYHSLGPQVPIVLFVHLMRQRQDRVFEFIALTAVSSLFTGPLMAIFPAAGAYAFYKPAPEFFSNLTAQAGMWHYSTLSLLRSGAPYDLIVSKAEGLVTFPSFHTALGILVVYAMRDVRSLFVLALIVNSVMIVSTLPEGGHHLVDVIVGAAIGALSVAIVRMWSVVPEKAATPEGRSAART